MRGLEAGHGTWRFKFRCAMRGARRAFASQLSLRVQLGAAAAVVLAAVVLGATLIEWAVLVLCMVVVLSAELMNTALEHLARAITREHSEELRNALDTGSGAVLLASIGAAVVGTLVLGARLACLLGW